MKLKSLFLFAFMAVMSVLPSSAFPMDNIIAMWDITGIGNSIDDIHESDKEFIAVLAIDDDDDVILGMYDVDEGEFLPGGIVLDEFGLDEDISDDEHMVIDGNIVKYSSTGNLLHGEFAMIVYFEEDTDIFLFTIDDTPVVFTGTMITEDPVYDVECLIRMAQYGSLVREGVYPGESKLDYILGAG